VKFIHIDFIHESVASVLYFHRTRSGIIFQRILPYLSDVKLHTGYAISHNYFINEMVPRKNRQTKLIVQPHTPQTTGLDTVIVSK
jgi:hypothetical protein